jgi:hypothetical protein
MTTWIVNKLKSLRRTLFTADHSCAEERYIVSHHPQSVHDVELLSAEFARQQAQRPRLYGAW